MGSLALIPRLASMEIARFQEQFVNRLLEEMTQMNNMHHAAVAGAGGSGTNHDLAYGQDNNWTFARAFLYSLTILTTIGALVIRFFSPPNLLQLLQVLHKKKAQHR